MKEMISLSNKLNILHHFKKQQVILNIFIPQNTKEMFQDYNKKY